MENKKKISKVLYIVVSAVLVLAAAFAVYAVKTDLFGKNEVNDEVTVTYTLSVTAEGESVFEGEVSAPEGTVLFDSMCKELEENDIEVISESGDYGAFITSIGGHAQNYDENLYWTFTVNGEMTMEGASSFVPSEGDRVDFVLEAVSW